jgi:RNA polymerase sigma-70 factor (ECF subfamily)
MIPLSQQDPALWDRALIDEGDAFLKRAFKLGDSSPRLLQAGIHAAWCCRKSLEHPAPWATVLELYDWLVELADNPVTRLNRVVALAEVRGCEAALEELTAFQSHSLEEFLPFRAVRADLLRRAGRDREAQEDYDAAIGLRPPPAEQAWLTRQRDSME